MSEDIAYRAPMLILAGLTAGWIAEAVARADGYGRILDTVLGLIGRVVVGSTGWVVNSGDAAMLGMFLIGGGGAGLAIVAQRRCWRFARLGA